ncbi:hypothetical protein AW736_03885 [Termitidicoccus mucosus]|uniref:Uncharacterized protein n=1 Tax=Termitidicoccus mucosus TaxID=1184151 RepID=A0A178INL1_9BACT|nr:hypothetical protein AW736_03885 [Opitutaceae bacterium TSB47]
MAGGSAATSPWVASDFCFLGTHRGAFEPGPDGSVFHFFANYFSARQDAAVQRLAVQLLF